MSRRLAVRTAFLSVYQEDANASFLAEYGDVNVFRRKEQRFLCASGSAMVRKNGALVSCPSVPFLSGKGKPRKGTDGSVVEAKALSFGKMNCGRG